MLNILNELKTILLRLKENEIEYALCGGLALAVYDRAEKAEKQQTGSGRYRISGG